MKPQDTPVYVRCKLFLPFHAMFSNKLQFQKKLLDWYDHHRRDLPWRTRDGSRPDAYHVLVSEFMLQQTQTFTVVPYFVRFVKRLPTLRDLAEADEQLVLKLWEGLGYYRRAKNLHAAARKIVSEQDGQIPADAASLLKLPGIGRYTAGAIASIAYDAQAPVLDGNVARVLCRLELIRRNPRQGRVQRQLWRLAEQLLPEKLTGKFNSALMELGATVCLPRWPKCQSCPVARHCKAYAAGKQHSIPTPARRHVLPLEARWTFCICRSIGNQKYWLIEQRPPNGRWPGLWQFVTVPAENEKPSTRSVLIAAGVKTDTPRPLGTIHHVLTHRRYRFDVYLCHTTSCMQSTADSKFRRWVRLDRLNRYPLSRPHLRIAHMLTKAH